MRVGFVRAFVGEPKLVILESPVQGLYQDMVPALLNRLCGGARPGRRGHLADPQPHDLGQSAVPGDPSPAARPSGPVRDQGGRMIRLRHTDEWVGALVIAAVALLLIAALQAGVLRDWFKPTAELRLVLPAAGVGGLEVGADVEILGTRAGRVDADRARSRSADVRACSRSTSRRRPSSAATARPSSAAASAWPAPPSSTSRAGPARRWIGPTP